MAEVATPMQVDETSNERPIQRRYVRQRQSLHKALALLDEGKFEEALKLLRSLLSEAMKFDDKALIVETHLMTARAWHAMGNPNKAMSSVVAARTGSAGVNMSGPVAAELEHMAALSNAADGDYSTAFSYWFEALQGYNALTDAASVAAMSGKSLLDSDTAAARVSSNLAVGSAGSPLTTSSPVAKTGAAAGSAKKPKVVGEVVDDDEYEPSTITTATSGLAGPPASALHGRPATSAALGGAGAAGAAAADAADPTTKSVYHDTKLGFARRAVVTCVYMLMCILLSDRVRELPKLLAGGDVSQYANAAAVRKMLDVVAAYEKRDLHAMEAVMSGKGGFGGVKGAGDDRGAMASPTGGAMGVGSGRTSAFARAVEEEGVTAAAAAATDAVEKVLRRDGVVVKHISALRDKMLARHIVRLCAPYERVQLSYLATCVGVGVEEVERKVAMMIMDREIQGVLQQGGSQDPTGDDAGTRRGGGAFLVRSIPPPTRAPVYSMLAPNLVSVSGGGGGCLVGGAAAAGGSGAVVKSTKKKNATATATAAAAAAPAGRGQQSSAPDAAGSDEADDGAAERKKRAAPAAGSVTVPLGVKAEVRSARLVEEAKLDIDEEEKPAVADGAGGAEGDAAAFYERALAAVSAVSEVVDAIADRHAREMSKFPMGIRERERLME